MYYNIVPNIFFCPILIFLLEKTIKAEHFLHTPLYFKKMQSSFVCSVCSLGFINKAQLKYHVRNNHQSSVVVSYNGHSRCIERGSDNEFKCPNCPLASKDPRTMYRHATCILSSNFSTVVTPFEESANPSHDDDTFRFENHAAEILKTNDSGPISITAINQCLSELSLVYDPQNRLIVCTKCPTVLNENFAEHSRKVHSLVIGESFLEKIRSNLSISSFDVSLAFPIPAIPNLPIVFGFQCPTCKWCCNNRKSMAEHYKSHPNNSYVQRSLQSYSRGCCLTLFPVLPPASPEYFDNANVEVSRIVETVSSIVRAPALVPENDRTRNILYTMAGWFTDETEFEDLKELDIHTYFDCPAVFTESSTKLEEYFDNSLKSVGSWDVTHRMDLGRLDKNKPLLPLKTVDSRKRYVTYWSGLVFFALNICSQGLQRYLTPNEAIRTVCGRLLLNFSESSLLELLRLLTQEKITGVQQTENIIPVYLKLTSLRKDFSLQTPEIVSQNGAKLQYLCRVVLYKCAEQSESKSEYLEANKEVLDPSKHYVFSFLTISTGLAQKVNMNAKALPSLVVLERGVSVQVRGSCVQLSKLVQCYAKCLREVHRLVSLLKLGVQTAVILNDLVDNLSDQTENYCFHHRNSKMQRDLEEAILHRVLTEESLGEQYVRERGTASIVLDLGAARQYLEPYDKLMENLILLVHLGSGMPARGTELSTYRILNGKSSPRSVYV